MSRVLVAGGTGVLGRVAVPALQDAGHEVVTTSRRASGLDGVRHIPADALDADATRRAVAEAAPEVVVHALTALPPEGPRKAGDVAATNRLRIAGTDNLVAACEAAGVRRLVGESFMLVYGTGPYPAEPVTEDAALAPSSGNAIVDALRHLEHAILDAQLEGIVLRFAGFYGLGSGTTEGQVAALRARRLPLPGGAPSVLSFIHIEDAARAIVAAVASGRPGEVYNVCDDEPVTAGTFFTDMARTIGAPRPRTIPLWLTKLVAPMAARFLAGTQLPLSNAKLRTLGWQPRYPTWREGLASLAPSGSGS